MEKQTLTTFLQHKENDMTFQSLDNKLSEEIASTMILNENDIYEANKKWECVRNMLIEDDCLDNVFFMPETWEQRFEVWAKCDEKRKGEILNDLTKLLNFCGKTIHSEYAPLPDIKIGEYAENACESGDYRARESAFVAISTHNRIIEQDGW